MEIVMCPLIDSRIKIRWLKAISLQMPIKVIISSLILLHTNLIFANEKIDDSNIEKTLIRDLDFKYGPSASGVLSLTIEGEVENISINQEQGKLIVKIPNAVTNNNLLRTYYVSDFGTPVDRIILNRIATGVSIILETNELVSYVSDQIADKYVLSISHEISDDESLLSRETFTGELISLNFQTIEVRSVLQILADFTDLNLVTSDAVSGDITLRLNQVPWDQALDLILKNKGLDKRQVGNVLMVAPAEEIAERERRQMETERQLAELAPLHSTFMRIRYAKAEDIVGLFDAGSSDGGSLISDRGSVVVDNRTNSLLITETLNKLKEIEKLVELVDVPVRQVMIEARIVIANSDAQRDLGIEWGGAYGHQEKGLMVSGDTSNLLAINDTMLSNDNLVPNYPGALLVDLGASGATSGIAMGYASSKLFLSAELSAMEASGNGEVISQPKVITGDKRRATIKSGREIPYQSGSLSGQNTTSFKEAVLELNVTPNITPDDRVLLDLVITQDSVGELVPSGNGGVVPSIDTTELTTQVLVGDGETVVLGGVFRTEDLEKIAKVPLFGDIPLMGTLFKNNSVSREKTETLVFITPHIIADSILN